LDREKERGADGVLFADADGLLVGIGRMLRAHPDVDTALQLKHKQLIIHYFGYAEMSVSQSVVGYAFRADRKDLCQFGEKKIRQ
jgi:hypothetical protein